jgi:phage terminase large subunit
MNVARIQLPPKLIPVFLGEAPVRGAFGGRGSAKTRSFAKMTAVRGYQWSMSGEAGIILCGREYMNSLDESSMAEVKAAIESEPWLAAHYDVGEKYIRTKDRRIEYAFTGLHHNLDSIKSKARIRILWVDEADGVTETAWSKAIPSVREDDSEIWVTWNPERLNSPTQKRFRDNPPEGAKIVEMNYRDNPWFPKVLERVRLDDLAKRPESYNHIWEGGFKTVTQGAYYAASLQSAREQKRIGRVMADPLMTYRAVFDIGGTGAKADAVAIWVVQFVGREVRCLNYYEARGQPLATHVEWLRDEGYGKAKIILPHDGAHHDQMFGLTYKSAMMSAGFKDVVVIPNQGAGAAKQRIEAARRLFPSIWFNEETTEAGLYSLGQYHEKIDEERGIGLGPDHDRHSHCADAFGLMCVSYEAPTFGRKEPEPEVYRAGDDDAGTSWMAS